MRLHLFSFLVPLLTWSLQLCAGAEIFMITMGGTKSHKIPFWELARGLIAKDHNVTFVSPFPADFHLQGLEEITPAGLVFFVRNFTNYDLVGARYRGEEPLSIHDAVRYGYEVCDAFLDDHETKELIETGHKYDLFIIDGAYPECALGIVHKLKKPFMYINTVGFYIGSISNSGSPTPYSITPVFARSMTDDMSTIDRIMNSGFYILMSIMHKFMTFVLHRVLMKHFDPSIPHPYEIGKNVSFILQNGHFSVSYPRPYLPNVAEIACIHCKPANPLNKDLEDFINEGGDNGFIFVSMGSSVKTGNMPEELRRILVRTFAKLPYQVLWKWEDDMVDLPQNVKISRWLPQQDLLGHRKIRAFVTHGGLLSMFETVYHGVPVVTMPVFCDHDSNAAKAELDGYAIKLDLQGLQHEDLLKAITDVINIPKYKEEVKYRQFLLRDQKETPLDTSVYWTEYVLRHKGAKHLLSPSRNFNFIQYYCLDIMFLFLGIAFVISSFIYWLLKASLRYVLDLTTLRKIKKD